MDPLSEPLLANRDRKMSPENRDRLKQLIFRIEKE